ncbi:formimidoylglutamate deiminase [Nordella sp. HKS 07]|uniref:formimidoylglutamate deiminase n=1 Tax=Nordella sp. HKS 07 TaxID=2712222 RepID=UPI0013E188EE|nr:formimidoylglutamate deiminase [Nordella sp. HKS 07]QIG47530.1 formimidoylglutamate deiminase [Nordella sp. HKS 07]
MAQRKLKFASALLPSGWQTDVVLTVDAQGLIETVETGNSDKTITTLTGFAIPAVPNVHSHAHQRLMTGLAEVAGPGADSFWTWREVMYGFALKLSPEDLQAVAAQLYVETLKSGSTVIGEFQYLHHQPDGSAYAEPAELTLRCLAAAEEAGIAITLLPTLYAYGGFGGQAPTPGQRRFFNGAERYLDILATLQKAIKDKPLHRLGISPHSLRAVTKELLSDVIAGLDRMGKKDAPIHIHVAEQTKEVDDCLAWSGARPVQYLIDNFDLSSRWCGIHATHMTADETERMATSGMIAGLCPTTEANLGDGIFPADRFLKGRGAIAIGSDSHISVSPAEDLRQLEYSQRLRDRTRNALAAGPGQSTGRTLLDQVLAGGAQSMTQPVGALKVGLRADIAVLDEEHPALIGRSGDKVIDSWIFSGGNPCVRDVFVAGRQVVEAGRHIHEDAIKKNFRAAVKRLTA